MIFQRLRSGYALYRMSGYLWVKKLISKNVLILVPYQINADLLAKTENPDVIVMHCLPAFHDLNTQIGQEIYDKYGLAELEITDEIFQKYRYHLPRS